MLKRIEKQECGALLIEDDCLQAMRAIPNGSVNLILCDLPYGTTQNAWDSLIPFERLWQQYRRILAPKGVVALMSQGPFTARVMLSQESIFKYKITWVKSKPTNFLNAKKQPLRKHEDICIFYCKQPNYNPQMVAGEAYDKGVRKNQLTGSYGEFRPAHVKSDGNRYPTDVVYFKTAESEGRVWHSTQKPVELGKYLVRTYTQPGDIVLDNAFGSGSFLVAATAEKRSCIGIELNRDIQEFKKGALDLLRVAECRIQMAVPKVQRWVMRANETGRLTETVSHFLGQYADHRIAA
jgi:site-specific DNA-methyltransferase (adenine-specific)/modification methylase